MIFQIGQEFWIIFSILQTVFIAVVGIMIKILKDINKDVKEFRNWIDVEVDKIDLRLKDLEQFRAKQTEQDKWLKEKVKSIDDKVTTLLTRIK